MKIGTHYLVTAKALFLLALIASGIYAFVHFEFYSFLMDPKRAIAFIESFHPYDDFVFIGFQTFQVLVAGAIPAEMTGFIGGYLYGPVVGTVYSTIGLSIGSWLAFLLARTYGLPLVRRVVRNSVLRKYDTFMENQGVLISFLLFLIPGFPKAAFCYIIGLSRMNIWAFVGVSTVGRLFGTILLSVSGNYTRNHNIAGLFVILAFVLVLLFLLFRYRNKLLLALTRRHGDDPLQSEGKNECGSHRSHSLQGPGNDPLNENVKSMHLRGIV